MAIDPKYQALIDADPLYSQYVSSAQAQSVADKASRDSAMRRALEEFGQMPDFGAAASGLGLSAADLASIYTPEAQGIAAANTAAGTSTSARLNQAYADAQRNVINALASRGMMRSGDTGYGLNKTNLANTQQQYDARKALLDYLGGAQSGYTTAEQNRQQGLYQSLTDAYNRALANWTDTSTTTTATTTPTTTTTGYAPSDPSTAVIPDAFTGPNPNYGPAGPGYSGGYTQPIQAAYAPQPKVKQKAPVVARGFSSGSSNA